MALLFFSLKLQLRNLKFINQNCFKKFITLKRDFCVNLDKNSEYFRNNNSYKTSVVQRISDVDKYQLAGPGFSFVLNENNSKSEEIFSHLMLRSNVMKLSTDHLKDILCLIVNRKSEALKYTDALKYLDEKCALSAGKWSIDLSLYVMDAWFLILGPKAFRKHYYSAVTSMWSRKINKCTKNHVVQMLYFIGMSKIPLPFLMDIFENKLESSMNDLLDEELAIALISFFKTSTKINSPLILSKSCKVAERFLINDDRFQLISILKCLRHAKYYDEKLWMLLKEYVHKNYKSFNFVECTNFLAAFAAQNLYDTHTYECLENQGIKALNKEKCYDVAADSSLHPSIRSRVKDFARFLWGLNSMGHSVTNQTITESCNFLKNRINTDEFDSQPHILVDCIQSLALLGSYPEEIVFSVLNPEFYKTVSYMQRDKPKYQFYFIQKCVLIESPNSKVVNDTLLHLKKAFHPIPKNLFKEIKERKGFQTLIEIMQTLNLNDYDFKFCYIIPHIMIAGILIHVKQNNKQNSEFLKSFNKFAELNIFPNDVCEWIQKRDSSGSYLCLEILDPSMCARNTTKPNGLMKTKLRHLEKMSFNVITLTTEEVCSIRSLEKPEQHNKITSILKLTKIN